MMACFTQQTPDTTAGKPGDKGVSTLGAGIYGAGLVMNVLGTLDRGEELKRQAYYDAEETLRESKHLQLMGLEVARDLSFEESEAVGAAKARRGKAGIKAGGSAGTLIDRIRYRYRRKRERLEKEIGFKTASAARRSAEIRRRGKSAEKTSKRKALSTGLGGVYKLYSYADEEQLFG